MFCYIILWSIIYLFIYCVRARVCVCFFVCVCVVILTKEQIIPIIA